MPSITARHRATIQQDGITMSFANRTRWARACQALAGQDVDVTIRKAATTRSLDQNAYLHGVALPMLAEYFGYDKDEWPALKLGLLGEWGGYEGREYAPGRAATLPRYPQTSELTTAQFADFIDWLVRWAAREYHVVIPLPNEPGLEAYDKL